MKVRLPKDADKQIKDSDDIYKIMQQILLRESKLYRQREYFWVIGLNTANNIEYIELVAIGSVKSVVTKPIEIYHLATSKKCEKIILVHNHPSGKLNPSEDDIAITKKLQAAGDLLEIAVLDHLIISETDYFSFYRNGYIQIDAAE